MGLVVFLGALIAVVSSLSLVTYLALRFGGDIPVSRTGSLAEADRQAKARSYAIDHLPPPSPN